MLPADAQVDIDAELPPYWNALLKQAARNESWTPRLSQAPPTEDRILNLTLLCNNSLPGDHEEAACNDADCRMMTLFYCDANVSGQANRTLVEQVTGHIDNLPLSLKLLIMISTGIISLITVIGNLMVLISFVIERSLRQATNYFIVSLAVTDVLIGLFSMNFYSLYIIMDYKWLLGELICDLWLALDFTVCLASQYTVFFITVDRYCSVKIATQYRIWRTDAKVFAMVLGSWFIPFSVFFTVILGWKYFYGRTRADTACEAEFTYDVWFTLILTIAYYWVTLVVMTVLYTEIYRVAAAMSNKNAEKRKQAMLLVKNADAKRSQPSSDEAVTSAQNSNNGQSTQRLCQTQRTTGTGSDVEDEITSYSRDAATRASQKSSSHNGKSRKKSIFNAARKPSAGAAKTQSEKQPKYENKAGKALRTITFILGFFVACWTPYHVVILINGFYTLSTGDPSPYTNLHVYNFSYWLCYLNSPINPLCYAFVNAQFKKTFMRIMRFDFRIR